ncbi:MAG: GldG family protein, partial [Clostridia bacterium]|nr:GldG family protein [Clostridia bacterium]
MNDKRTYKAPVKNAAAKKPETKITKKAAPAQAAEGSFRAKFSKVNFKLRKQRLKYGSLATVVSLLLVTAVILGNVLVGFATDKYGLKFDMTSDQRFELSDATIDMLEDLDKEVTFHIFMTEENFRGMTYGNEMAEIMYRYEVYSGGKVTVNFVDPVRNPGFVHKYESIVEISSGSIVIESGDKYRALSLVDLYYWYDSTQSNVVGVSIERRLSNAILYMDVENPPMAVVITGHSEVGSSNIAQQFYEANYNVMTLNLMTEEIPEEASVVIVCCPTTDYTESEILKLEKYFKSFRDFIYIAGADAPTLTNLELLFREWGAEFDNSLVCDSQYRVGGNYVNVATVAVAEDSLTSGFASSKYVIAPYSKPMSIVPLASELYSVTELLQ